MKKSVFRLAGKAECKTTMPISQIVENCFEKYLKRDGKKEWKMIYILPLHDLSGSERPEEFEKENKFPTCSRSCK